MKAVGKKSKVIEGAVGALRKARDVLTDKSKASTISDHSIGEFLREIIATHECIARRGIIVESGQNASLRSNAGHQAFLTNPAIRKRIAEKMLEMACFKVIAYTSIRDEVGKEYGIGLSATFTAQFSSRKSLPPFIFAALIESNEAYVRYKQEKDFQLAVDEAVNQLTSNQLNESNEARRKNAKISAEKLSKRFGVECLYVVKYLLCSSK